MLGQKSSKERFIAAQFDALISDSFLEKNCGHAVKMSSMLKQGLEEIDTKNLISYPYPVQANVVFPALPPSLCSHLEKNFSGMDVWEIEEGKSVVRLMTSWSTSEEKVEEFLRGVREWYEGEE